MNKKDKNVNVAKKAKRKAIGQSVINLMKLGSCVTLIDELLPPLSL